jgi:hypothetical protein
MRVNIEISDVICIVVYHEKLIFTIYKARSFTARCIEVNRLGDLCRRPLPWEPLPHQTPPWDILLTTSPPMN